MTDYKPGDKVRRRGTTGDPATVKSGPHRADYRTVYVLQQNGDLFPVFADDIESAAPADPRREVVAKALADREGYDEEYRELHGMPSEFPDMADAVLAALDSHAAEQAAEQAAGYTHLTTPTGAMGGQEGQSVPPLPLSDAPARYRDREGDVWEGQPDGSVLLVKSANYPDVEGSWFRDLESARELYGPLTRI